MKYLFTFVVVSRSLRKECSHRINSLLSQKKVKYAQIKEFEDCINNALSQNINDIAYYRSVMDGWNPTYLFLKDVYINECKKRGIKKQWNQFIDKNIFYFSENNLVPYALMPEKILYREIKKVGKRMGLGYYAAEAFLFALYDCMMFSRCTKSLGFVLARRLGCSMGDGEYTDEEYDDIYGCSDLGDDCL
jgi:hypothetical protein